MTKAWFRPLRGSYIAANAYGALTYIPFVAYLFVSAYIPFDNLAAKLAIFIVIPNWVVATLVMTVLAKSKS
jgi:hypothetical protein